MKLIYIEWIDAMADDIGWKALEDALNWGENVYCMVKELGFVVDDADDYLLLASKVNGDMISGLMKIPKKYITKRIDIEL